MPCWATLSVVLVTRQTVNIEPSSVMQTMAMASFGFVRTRIISGLLGEVDCLRRKSIGAVGRGPRGHHPGAWAWTARRSAGSTTPENTCAGRSFPRTREGDPVGGSPPRNRVQDAP